MFYVLPVALLLLAAAFVGFVMTSKNASYNEWAKQLAVWLGIATLLPLVAWFGTAAFTPRSDDDEFNRVQARLNERLSSATTQPDKEALRTEIDEGAKKHADAEHRFGHGKAEPLAGLVQVAFILGSSILLLVEVFNHFTTPTPVTNPTIGIVVMVASILVTAGLIVFQRRVIRRTQSLAIKADSAHYLSDFLVNVSVIAALLLSAEFGWWWIDPLFGLGVALFIAVTAIGIGREAFDMLMDREMEDAERTQIKTIVRRHPQVLNLHELKTRVAGQIRFIQFHLELDGGISLREAHRISDAVEDDIMAAFPGAEVIIHQDPHGVAERRRVFG